MGRHGGPRDHTGPGPHLTVIETNNNTLSGLEPLLSIEELAEYPDVPVTTIRDWRTDGRGTCAINAGGRVRFATSDVLAWQRRHARPSRGTGRAAGERPWLSPAHRWALSPRLRREDP
jgi:hypothetical protein